MPEVRLQSFRDVGCGWGYGGGLEKEREAQVDFEIHARAMKGTTRSPNRSSARYVTRIQMMVFTSRCSSDWFWKSWSKGILPSQLSHKVNFVLILEFDKFREYEGMRLNHLMAPLPLGRLNAGSHPAAKGRSLFSDFWVWTCCQLASQILGVSWVLSFMCTL